MVRECAPGTRAAAPRTPGGTLPAASAQRLRTVRLHAHAMCAGFTRWDGVEMQSLGEGMATATAGQPRSSHGPSGVVGTWLRVHHVAV